MKESKQKFFEAIQQGIKNATDSELFIKNIKKLLQSCNEELAKVKIDKDAVLEFEFKPSTSFQLQQHSLVEVETDSFSGTIIFNVNGQQHKSMIVTSELSSTYRIDYNDKHRKINFPNIDEFEALFHDYICSAQFGELISYHVKLD